MRDAKKDNLLITFIMWLVLGGLCISAMLITASHKTIVIADTAKEPGSINENMEQMTAKGQGTPLLLQGDSSVSKSLRIPLEKGIKAENVVMENRYMDKELWIYIYDTESSLYDTGALTGDITPIEEGCFEVQGKGIILKLKMKEVFDYHSTLENDTLTITYANPRDLYSQIVVIDTMAEKEGKNTVMQVAGFLQENFNQPEVKLYFTGLEDVSVSEQKRLELIDNVKADLYLGIRVTADEKNTEAYGIQGFYNEEYFIPDFGNVDWADVVTRNVTVAVKNRALGLTAAEKDSILQRIKIPAAQVSLGYITNEKELGLLKQESYQEKLAEGIANAIMEVYTNKDEK